MKNIFDTFTKDDFFKNVNFHIHSTFSDGRVEFETLIKEAKELNLKYYSITDHNTIEGYKNLKELPEGLITGVEFDCYMDFNLPHIVGLNVDINNEKLNELCTPFKKDIFETPRRIFSSRNPKKVIDAIHRAGGIAILAHPCCYWCLSLDKFVKKLVDMGLDGIEVYYPYNRLTRIIKFHSRKTPKKLAKKYNLLISGGEDQHKSLIHKKRNINWERIV